MRLRLVLVAMGCAIACGGPSVQLPAYGRHTTAALVEVPYPPPPARMEMIPKAPSDDAVWIDGEWVWQLRRWAWKPGRWVAAPKGAVFVPWTSVRDGRGVLFVASGIWRDSSGRDMAEPAPLAAARARPGTVVTPEGDIEPAAPAASLDAGTTRGPDAGAAPESLLDDGRATLLPDGGTLEAPK
jgi:hypothetical protein